MTPLIMPALLDPADYQLVLTPGTYSDLVIDTLGEAGFDSDPDLAAADDAAVNLGGLSSELPDGDGDIADMTAASDSIDPNLASELQASMAQSFAEVNTDAAAFDAAGLAFTQPPVPLLPPGEPAPLAGSLFATGQILTYQNAAFAAAGGKYGGTPNIGEDVSIYGLNYVPGATYQVYLLVQNLAPYVNEPATATLDPSSDPSVVLSNFSAPVGETWIVSITIKPTAVGQFSARISITHPSFQGTQVWGFYYTAAAAQG